MSCRIGYYGGLSAIDNLVFDIDFARNNSYSNGSTSVRSIVGTSSAVFSGASSVLDYTKYLYFDGSGDYLYTDYINGIKSLQMWIKLDSVSGGVWQYLIDDRDDISGSWFTKNGFSTGFDLVFYVNGVSKSVNYYPSYDWTSYVSSNTWTNLYVQFSSISDGRLTFMSYYDHTIDFMAGSISCVHVYNRNLTSGEIIQNYNSYRNRFGV